MLLEEGADLAVEHVGPLEVRGVSGGGHALEARAGYLLVHHLGQLGPGQPVFVAGEEHGRDPRGRVALDLRGETAEVVTKIGRQRSVEPGDLRIEERARRMRLAKRLSQSRLPEHGGTGRAGRGQPLAQTGDVGIAEITRGVGENDGPESPGRLHGGSHGGPSAHRLGDHGRLFDAQVIEEREDIPAEGGRPRPARHVRRLPEASLVRRDAAILLGEYGDLLPPDQMIAAGPMEKQEDRAGAAHVLVVEAKAVVHHEGHVGHPLVAASTAAVSYNSWNSTILSPRNVQKSDFGVSTTRPVFRLRQPVEPSMATRSPSAMNVPVVKTPKS